MTAGEGAPAPSYLSNLIDQIARPLRQLMRPVKAAPETSAALARTLLAVLAGGIVLIVMLMVLVDVPVIKAMPPRGSPQLWWARILTEFGKSAYVLWTLGLAWIAVSLVRPAVSGTMAARLQLWQARLLFLFFCIAVSVMAAEVLKILIGRGRPFVGGQPNAFNFSPFNLSEAFASIPSGHATTAAALAVAVASLWPRLRIWAALYVLVILGTRMLLLAHHPSDVVAGATVGICGALVVRHWFAQRHICVSYQGGNVHPLTGMVLPGARKGVAGDRRGP